MFYDKFIELCNIKKEKPTPLLNKLGLSSGNLKRWKNGSSVNFDTIKVLADYFNVTIDYFFDETSEQTIEYVSSGNSFKGLYELLKAHPDHIASFTNGTNIPDHSDYERIAQYMNTEVRYIASPELFEKFSEAPNSTSVSKVSNISTKDLILNILGKIPANGEYKFLQVRISMVILRHLLNMGITAEQLEKAKLIKEKIYGLSDLTIDESKKKSLNFSDLIRISETFNIDYDYMLSGEKGAQVK